MGILSNTPTPVKCQNCGRPFYDHRDLAKLTADFPCPTGNGVFTIPSRTETIPARSDA